MAQMHRRVALVGMYGGYFAERNPGCFLILEASLRALEQRLPETSFDIYSQDTVGRTEGLRQEVVHGRTLHYFSSYAGPSLLDSRLGDYDALVFGGDIILAPPPPPSVFFLESPGFQPTTSPPIFYNAAHTSLSAEDIQYGRHAERLRRLCEHATYVGVRTVYARDALRTIGDPNKIAFAPDPALSLDLQALVRTISSPAIESQKKILGVSLMAHFIEPVVEAISNDAALLNEYEVWIYPYSRQYNHIEAVLRIRQRYGDRFKYIDRYQDPLDTVALMSQFDASINDTYHGTIVALLMGVPFLVIDREDPLRSRNRNLLELFSLEERIVSSARHGITDSNEQLLLDDALVQHWAGFLQTLRESPRGQARALHDVQALVESHFDRIAQGILAASPLTPNYPASA